MTADRLTGHDLTMAKLAFLRMLTEDHVYCQYKTDRLGKRRIMVIEDDGAWAWLEDTYAYQWALQGKYLACSLDTRAMFLTDGG